MAFFTKNQQRNGTNCQFEKYVTTSNYFVLNSLDRGPLNSVCTHYVCDKSENARVCAKWQFNALNWCYWIALPASPVVQSSNTVSCVSLSFRTHPCVLAIVLHQTIKIFLWQLVSICYWNLSFCFTDQEIPDSCILRLQSLVPVGIWNTRASVVASGG